MISIVEWAVLEMASNERYLVGVERSTRDVAISVPIRDFVPGRRLIIDKEETCYELADTGLVSVPARRAWRQWCRERGDPPFLEVTEEYEAALEEGA